MKNCVLRLTPDKLYFVFVERGTVGGINIWCELVQVGIISALVFAAFHLMHIAEIMRFV